MDLEPSHYVRLSTDLSKVLARGAVHLPRVRVITHYHIITTVRTNSFAYFNNARVHRPPRAIRVTNNTVVVGHNGRRVYSLLL